MHFRNEIPKRANLQRASSLITHINGYLNGYLEITKTKIKKDAI